MTRNLFDIAAIAVVHGLSHLPIIADPSQAKTMVPALSRIPTLDEFNTMQGMTGPAVKAMQVSRLPSLFKGPDVSGRDASRQPLAIPRTRPQAF